jgi:Bifunctional DNA primase/polymerase, N-terminal
MKPDTLEAALSYVEGDGLSVIPLRPGDKRPAIPSWERFQRERPSEDEITSWFGWGDNNLGIVTGEISGLVVVDLDGDDGETSYNGLGWPTDSRMVVTWAGGVHVYFRHPGGKVGNRVRMRPGLDIRGDGGYVVAPPSLIEGGQYDWLTPIRPLLPLPANPDREPSPKPGVRDDGEAPGAYVRGAFEAELRNVAAAIEGTRNDQLNNAVFAIARFVSSGQLSRHVVESAFLNVATAKGLGEREAQATIKSAIEAR